MKILHIDDVKPILDSFSEILTLYGYDVVSCSDGKTGLKLLSEQKFDVLFLDLAMPDFSGFDVLDELETQNLSIPNIFIFSAITLKDEEKTLLSKKGVKKILSKPINIEQLLLDLKSIHLEVIIHE